MEEKDFYNVEQEISKDALKLLDKINNNKNAENRIMEVLMILEEKGIYQAGLYLIAGQEKSSVHQYIFEVLYEKFSNILKIENLDGKDDYEKFMNIFEKRQANLDLHQLIYCKKYLEKLFNYAIYLARAKGGEKNHGIKNKTPHSFMDR